MLTYDEIERLPSADRAVTRASHEYYWVLLSGASKDQRRRLLSIWWKELQRRWPDIGAVSVTTEDPAELSTPPKQET